MKKLTSLAALLAALAVPTLAQASVTYNLTLTDAANPTYSGTGSITLATAPSATGLSNYASGQYSGLNFTVGGQTFTAPPGSVSAVQFLDGSFYDITFSQQIGTTPNRYSLQTTSVYAFSYNDLQSTATGTITASLASTPVSVPEPATAAMLLGGLATLGWVRRRRT